MSLFLADTGSQISNTLKQNPVLKDFAIVGAIVVVLIIIQIPLSIRRRPKRHEARKRIAHDRAQPGGTDPIDGMAALAAAQGWTGPSTDPQLDNEQTTYTHEMLRNLWGYPRRLEQGSSGFSIDPKNIFTNVFHGTCDSRPFTIANTRLNVGRYGTVGLERDADRWASVCVMRLPMTLPPLYVNLHHHDAYRGLMLKHSDFESEQFNRTFDVESVNPKLASDVITPQVMELLLTRDDWVLAYQMDSLICLCANGLHSADDYDQRVKAVAQLIGLLPEFVADDDALKLPTLPDGTVLSPSMSKDEREQVMAKVMAMNPEQRTEFMRTAQVDGMEAFAEMFGKHIDEGALQAAVDKNIAEQQAEHPERFGTT
jgi:hypothetical protein